MFNEDEVFMPIFSPLWGQSPKKAVLFLPLCDRLDWYRATTTLVAGSPPSWLFGRRQGVNSERYYHIITIIVNCISPWRCPTKNPKCSWEDYSLGDAFWRFGTEIKSLSTTNVHAIFSWHNRKKTRTNTVT